MKGRRIVYVLLAVAVVLSTVVIVGLMIYNKPHQLVSTAPPAFTMTAAQLIDQFSQDEAEANTLYAGKVIQLNGPLKDVFRNDSTMILLLGDTTTLIGVSCYLQNIEKMDETRFAPGEMVTVKGICNGLLMDVVLDKAVLLTNERP